MLVKDSRVRIKSSWLLIAVLLCAATARAQMEIGDNLKMSLNGSLGFGYSGAFGNADMASTHSKGLTGSGDLNGSYFNPNFLSFHFRPYYDHNQSNSESQVVTRSTGLGLSLNLFGGSRFPGSITFGKDFSSNSEFRLAGVPTISGDTSGQAFGISWNALLPHWPTLSVSYSVSSTTASFAGFQDSHNSSNNLNLHSGYQIAGFDLRGSFSHTTSSSEVPEFLGLGRLTSGGSSNGYSVTIGHKLPLKGSFGSGWSHSHYTNDNGNEWDTTSYTAGTYFTPWHRLSLFQNATYTTDLTAALSQSILQQPGVVGLRSDSGSSGAVYGAGASLYVGHGISVSGHFNHRVQWFSGRRYMDTQYGGAFNYNHASRLFGFLYFSVGVVDTASQLGNNGAGLNATVGMNRKFGYWDTSAEFNYSQNIQTLGTLATTSSYTYGFSARRRINERLRWNGSFRGSHSALVVQEGTGNRAESIGSGISWGRYNVSASYSQSSGAAVFGPTGELTATPLGSLITDRFLLFNARSLGVGASSRLFRSLTVTGGYSKFKSSTTRAGAGTSNSGDHYNVRAEYRLRKFTLQGGFNRSMQEVSTVPGGPRLVNSFYVSFSRWFNVF